LNSYNNILQKLGDFTKKYYTKLLLKGILLFLAFGLLFFLAILGVEYFLWLNSTGRLVLLLVFVGIALFLLYKYILTPIFYLFRIKKGISNKQASILIGKHFPDVDDKLLNLLDLAKDNDQSELLLASIEQRSASLNPIPFAKAIDFRENLKYVKYLAIPAILFGLIWFSGNLSDFFGSYNRVVNYDVAYEPPAPFSFKLLSGDLEALDSEAVTVQVITEGEIRPDQVFIAIKENDLLLQEQNGIYQYTFNPPLSTTDFYFKANGIFSRKYTLNALETPSIQDFKLLLNYPNYTNRKSEILKSTGNASFPEGTKVTWQIDGKNTENIHLITKDTSITFSRTSSSFETSKRVYSNLEYELSTSNKNISDYEKLGYRFDVVKDAYPTIKTKQVLDSLNPNTSYYVGEASDDYKLKRIRLVCYPDANENEKQIVLIGEPNSNFNQFYFTFPSGIELEPGKNYSYYFEATDNDRVHNGKTSKSQIYSTVLLDENELKNKELESQQSIIDNLDKSLEKFKEQKETLKEINQNQKEKEQLNFNDQNQIKDFLKKQQQQEQMMEKFSKQLKDNLNKSKKEDEMNELLKERLERQEMEAKKNEKLLEELNKIADKIDKEELAKRLEELGKKQQNSERNLEQLLELTKRYYVTEKAAQIADELEKLAEKQDEEADKEDINGKEEEQKKLNEEFEKLAEEMEELKKDNQDLKKPLDLDLDKKKQDDIKKDQKQASEELNKEKEEPQDSEEKKKSGEKASQKQKSAAQKMKEMSEKLQKSSAGGGGGSSVAEDAEMLRQILDNLVIFSFKQENLYDSLDNADIDAPQFSSSIRKQQELRKLFEHVDDSLFSLSLRQAELSEFVNEQITEVYYNTDKALEAIAESQIYQGVSYQKYVLNAANSLSDFLANILDNMQQSMQSGQGEGEGEGFQLPDIIKQQGELKEKMEGQGKSVQGKPKPGEGKGEQDEGKEGEGEGESGKEGNKGKGEKGQGEQGGSGKGGNGEGGEGEGDGEGNGKGKSENGKNGKGGEPKGEGDGQESGGPSEEELQEIYEIYKEQQIIRARLEEQLLDMISGSDRKLGEKLLKQIEDFENDLLENGFTQRGLNKMNNIQYEMLKLKDAAMKQGKKPERESNTNKNEFTNPIITKPSLLDDYRNEIEILNRQALPLRQNFQIKVKEYFKSDD
jgi:hypothetical protein